MQGMPGSSPDHDSGAAPGVEDALSALARADRRARLRRGLVASILTLGALTLVLELGLRLTGHRERVFEASVNRTIAPWVALTRAGIFEEVGDPVRRYALAPGASCEVAGLRFRVSSHRTRGEDFPLEKPAGERRLLCLGDSFAFGLWSDDEETVVGHLARMANERERELSSDVTWRAVDLGVPGYHAGQQLRAFEQDGLALDPDLVLLYFNTNDIEQEGFFYDAGLGVLRRDFLPLPTGLRRLLWHSHLYGWIARRHRLAMEAGPLPPHMDPRVPYAFVREDNQRATRASIERIRDLCRERGVPLFWIDQPHLTWQGEIQDPAWSMLPLVEWAGRTRAELGIPGVSLLGLFRGYSDGVDRSAEGVPPDLLLDTFVADERVQAAVLWARERVEAEGRSWEDLDASMKLRSFAGYPGEMPERPDFHLNGEGYGHIARVVFRALEEEGLLP